MGIFWKSFNTENFRAFLKHPISVFPPSPLSKAKFSAPPFSSRIFVNTFISASQQIFLGALHAKNCQKKLSGLGRRVLDPPILGQGSPPPPGSFPQRPCPARSRRLVHPGFYGTKKTSNGKGGGWTWASLLFLPNLGGCPVSSFKKLFGVSRQQPKRIWYN